jgi:hypothetical protein
MTDRIIYIVCHDDASEKIARDDFDKYNWARVYRIPEEAQNHLFEGVMYTTELMKVYNEWKHKTYVGTLTYKVRDRIKVGSSSTFERLNHLVTTSDINFHSLVSFTEYNTSAVDTYPSLRKILTETCEKVGYQLVKSKYTLKTKKVETTNFLDARTFTFHNYWMTTPALMLEYISFFNTIWMPALESHTNIWDDSTYHYRLQPEDRLKKLLFLTKGRTSHCPYHALANERLPTIFFKLNPNKTKLLY